MPLCIDLFCGLGGWAEGFLSEGWDVIGFDNHQHVYGEARYPAQLVIQDVLTLHGSQFRNADCIVASPPCQRYSYMAMPWSLAKREVRWQEWERDSKFGDRLADLNALFNACFRIQREACAAAGRHIPMVVENVKGAQKWVGRAAWHFGSFYLWGDVPAIMPILIGRSAMKAGIAHRSNGEKTAAHANKRDGHDHTRHLTNQRESDALKVPGVNWSDRSKPAQGFNVEAAKRFREDEATKRMSGLHGFSHPDGKGGRDLGGPNDPRRFNSRSDSRKAASAMIAKIPPALSEYIARYYHP